LPAGTHGLVLLQVADPADRRPLASAAELDVFWIGPGEDLAEQVNALRLPQGDGYAWAAGEAASMARVRQVLLTAKAHPHEAMRVASYWSEDDRDGQPTAGS
jgi:NADPH-dependent ferric siderophore reductase